MTEKGMIQELVKDGYVSSKEIIRAMGEIHREQFVLEEERSRAYENLPLSTGGGLFVSQPSTAGFLLELLKPKQGEKILVIGAGTGWIAGIIIAIISKEKKEGIQKGKVIAIEPDEESSHVATKNLERYSYISDGVAEVINDVWNSEKVLQGPYDGIIVLRGIKKIPQFWYDTVRVGGRIIVPIGESIFVKEKTSGTEFKTREYFGFNFPQFS